MIKSVLQKLLIGALPLAMLIGCMDDAVEIKDLKYDRPLNVAGPLGGVNLSVKTLLEKLDSLSYIYADNEGLLHVQVEDSFNVAYDDVIEFNELNTTYTYDINPNVKTVLGPFVDTLVVNVLSIGEDNQRFDSLTIETADILFDITLPPQYEGNYTITLPEVKKADGTTVSLSRDFSNTSAIDPIDLAGGRIGFQNLNGKSFITIITDVEVTNTNGNITNTDMNVVLELQSMTPYEVFGYFGKINAIEQKQEQEFNFFETFDLSEVAQFKDITLELSIDNYFGLPMGLYIDSLAFENTKTGSVENIVIDDNSIEITPATYGDPIIPSNNIITINSTNSNLIDGINLGPNHFYVEVNGLINPNGETVQNFVNTQAKVEGRIRVDLPLWFKTSLYQRTDTIPFDLVGLFSDSTQVDMVEALNMEMNFTNGFPFNIQAQIYMTDTNYVKIDSLFNEAGGAFVWESATVDADGIVTTPTETQVNIQVLKEKVKKFYDNKAKNILIQSSVSTGDKENPQFVKLYEDYSIQGSINFEIKSGEINY